MESYAFRPKQNALPKLTNSTFYKTLKLAKTKSISAKDIYNPNNISNINNDTSQTIQSNKSIKNANNQMFNKKINFSKINPKNRSLSVHKINREISSQETDDSLFALSQIKNMDRIIANRINKKVIWKQKTRNIYDVDTSHNTKQIKSIKEHLHQSRFEDSKNFDLKNEINRKKYFPMEKVPIVNDAKNIMKKMEYESYKNKSTKNFFVKKRVDMHTFVIQNREICLKNNMIKIIKKESERIKQKEIDFSKALKEADKGIKKDEKAFSEFIVQHQILTKKKEFEVEEAKRAKKRCFDALYQITATVRMKYDDVEKIINNIKSFFKYAKFIHGIIGSQALKDIKIEKLTIKPSRNRAKDINYLLDTVFELFGFLLEKNSESSTDLDFDANQVTYLFDSLEQVVIKHVMEKNMIDREIETLRNNSNSDLDFLRKKKAQHQEELTFLKNELNYLNKLYQPLNKEYESNLKKAEKYINEILLSLRSEDEIATYEESDPNEDNDICKQTFDILNKVENKLVFYINEIENIERSQKENDETFKTIIEQVRNENKRIKIKNSKKLLEDLEEEKLMKYKERMSRIPIKYHVEYIPPWILKERNKKDRDQWIPWEISYSLKETSRKNKKGEAITSHTNAMLAVILPDTTGSYDWYLEAKNCCISHCTFHRTDKVFNIIRRNKFNRIKNGNNHICDNNEKIWTGTCSYIEAVKWDDFITDYHKYVDMAVDRQDNINEYDIYKEI